MQPRTGGEAVAEQLVRSGVDTVFGVPGVQLDYLVDGFAQREDRLRYISCRHEQGAAYMADGYARATGRPGVFSVVPGPGVLNATAALSTAYACSSPVVCLAAQIAPWAIGRNLGLLHDVTGQDTVLRAVTKHCSRVEDVNEFPEAVHGAIGRALSGRPRPVALEMPDSLLKAPFSGSLVDVLPAVNRVTPDTAAIAAAAALLGKAEHPVIYAGGGVVVGDASAALEALSTALRAPVVTSNNGRGAISDRHPWALTSLGGRRVLPQADVVLLVGSRGLRMAGLPLVDSGAKQIMINAQEEDFGPPREPEVTVHADARLGLEALLAELPTGRSAWTENDIDATRMWCAEQIAPLGELVEWVTALRRGIADDGILVGELTQTFYLSRVAYPMYAPRTNLSPGYQGTLGYGSATAMGAKLGRPGVPVVSISGDGGFCYQLGELLTAVQYQIPVVFVVFNDGAYGNVMRTQMEDFGGRVIGTRLANPDFPAMAKSFGMDAVRLTRPHELTGTLRELRATTVPVIVEVPVGPFNDPAPLIREVPARRS
ncbi:MAG: thiamine pyrophosphate-binding protein [Candidatus Dormibacter sp.]